MFNRALKRKLTNRKWCNIYFKRDNSSLMVKNRQPLNDRQKEHESGNTLQKMYLSKSLVQICDITLYKIEVIFLWMCCTVCQHPHTHNAAPHWLLIIPTSKTRLHYFQTRFSCTWTEHRNSRLCKKTNKEKIKKNNPGMHTPTHANTDLSMCTCIFVFRSNGGGGSGNGPSAGERLPQATSPADAQRSGPRVFRHHAPPQRHRGLRLRHPHLQEQTAVRRWDRGLSTLSRMNYYTTRWLFLYSICYVKGVT